MITFEHIIAFLIGMAVMWVVQSIADWIERIRLRRAYSAIRQHVNEIETEIWEKEKSEA